MATEILSPSYDAFPLSHTAATTAKNFLLINSKVVMPLNTALANAANAYVFRAPKVRVPKTTAQAWAPMNLIYWDDTAKKFTTTATANTLAGRVVEAAASADAEGIIDLDPAA